MKKLMMAAVIAAVACGCVTVNKNEAGNSAIRPNLVKDRIAERYEVENKTVEAVDQVNCLFGFICWGSSASHIVDFADSGFGGIGKAKNGAYANACDAAKCDAIVGTRYTVTTFNDFFVFKQIRAEIKGFPANIKGVDVIPADKDTKPECCGGKVGLPF